MSNNLNLDQLTTSQSSKEATINNATGQLDAALTENAVVDVASGNVTVALGTLRRVLTLTVKNATVARNVILPVSKKLFSIINDSSNTHTFSLVVGSTSLLVPVGSNLLAFTDGTTNGLYSMTGLTGPAGPTGPTGSTGSTGATGAAGSVWYEGSGAPAGGLGVNGDFYINTATSDVYTKAAGSWGLIMTLTGGGGGSTTLHALIDVSIAEGPAIDGYTLNWNDGAGKWEAVAPVTAAVSPAPWLTAANLPLDAISGETCIGAYGLRKLRAAYAGHCLKVRRSSDSTTADIDFLSNGDVDMNAIAAFVGVGNGYVQTWYDQSGAGNDMGIVVADGATKWPFIVQSGYVRTLNRRACISLAAAGQTTGGWLGPASSAGNISTLSVAALKAASAGTNRLINGANNWYVGYNGGPALYNNGAYTNDGTTGVASVAGDPQILISTTDTAVAAKLFNNAAEITQSGSNKTGNPGVISIGYYGGFHDSQNFDVATVLIFSSVLSGTSIAALTKAEGNYWDILGARG